MDLALPAHIEELRQKTREFVDECVIPLEADPGNYDQHENINVAALTAAREEAKNRGLWAPQAPAELGGLGLDVVGRAVVYEEANRSIFGPVAMNCAAPDEGNITVLAKVATDEQKAQWLQPIIDGNVNSAFAMTEPAPGGGSDPSMIQTKAVPTASGWKIYGRKWFITGAAASDHFVLIARTDENPDEKRRHLSAFLFHKDQPGWRIVRRIGIMGPEEHGGHCELEFDGLEIKRKNLLMGLGDGLKLTQIRLGTARLTHCMRWLGLSKRCMEIASEYTEQRSGFGVQLADRESVQLIMGELAHDIEIGRLLVMKAAWKLDQGDFARKEVSMSKIHVANTLHKAADRAIQLNGARGYSKDTVLEWVYRYARQARLVDGADEVHKMVLAGAYRREGSSFWAWGV